VPQLACDNFAILVPSPPRREGFGETSLPQFPNQIASRNSKNVVLNCLANHKRGHLQTGSQQILLAEDSLLDHPPAMSEKDRPGMNFPQPLTL